MSTLVCPVIWIRGWGRGRVSVMARLSIAAALACAPAVCRAQTDEPAPQATSALALSTEATPTEAPAPAVAPDHSQPRRNWFSRTRDPEAEAREAASLQRRRDELARRELEVGERSSQLEASEANLLKRHAQRPTFRLRDLLNNIDRDNQAAEREMARLHQAAESARDERARIEGRLDLLTKRNTLDEATNVDLNGQLANIGEQIEWLNLQSARWEALITLSSEAMRIEKAAQQLLVNARPTVRLLADKHRLIGEERKRLAELELAMATTRQVQEDIAPALELLQSKQTQIQEKIQLLENKYELNRDRAIRADINVEKQRHEVLAKRADILGKEVTEIGEGLKTLNRLRDVYQAELDVLREDVDAVQHRYWLSVLTPLAGIGLALALYLIVSRVILPRCYHRDRLFVARRMGRYLALMVILGLVLSFFFEDLRPFATTLGIAGAAVVIALQDLCSAFAGWFVIVSSRKIGVGDRIEVDGHRGDVIDIQLLRTTLLELSSWLGVDEPTGRVIIIPNNFIFKDKVLNFTHVHPYIWNKIDITVTYETPMREAEALLRRVLEEETREEFAAARLGASKMEQVYGVPDSEYVPKLYSVIADSGVLFQLLYVAHYRTIAGTRTRINSRILREFEADPRMQLAYPTQREVH